MKLFIGITPPAEITTKIKAVQAHPDFKQAIRAPRNSPPHVTLLRPYQTEDVDQYIKAVGTAVAGFGPVKIKFGDAQFFHDSIAYLSIKSPTIEALHNQIKTVLDKPERQPYIPHLTLGHLRDRGDKTTAAKLNVPGEFTVGSITVFGREVEDTPYQIVSEVKLTESSQSSVGSRGLGL